ncbi:retrotransposon protein, putative, ty1-copia subclass [Tanacetum coccineum]
MFIIEQPLPAAPAANSEANVLLEWNAIYDAYNEVVCLILGSMTAELYRQFENSSPYDMIKELKMKGYVDQLERLGYVLPQDLIVGLILNGLTKDFSGFVINYNMHNMGKTVGELHAMLIEYEKSLTKKAETSQVMMIKGGKIQKANKKSLKAKGKDDESFDQCVSCLSGKITRKSFSHRPERETDLLGIIHTDVCGPLRHVSRQGASYFITFTDDYSRNDRGGEYISQEFKDYLKAYGTVQQLTPPYTPQHNGVSERRNCTLLDMVRSMMNLTTLPLSFWDYALESATSILNMVPTKKVDKTPYELWYGKVPNLSYLKVWGCEALIKRDTPEKLQQRSVNCIFIGYPKEAMSYYFYFPHGRAIDLKEIQDEDTSPSEITRKIPMEVEEADEHSLGDLNEPTSYKATMLDSESNKWIDAMNAEIQSMMDNMVWVLVDLPPGCKTVRSKWIFKKKTDMDGIVHTYKARLVAKGYTQLYGVDYEETFSPVADIRAIRILISIAAYYDYEIWQMDIKTAFLNGYLDEDIYMVQPKGVIPYHPEKSVQASKIQFMVLNKHQEG